MKKIIIMFLLLFSFTTVFATEDEDLNALFSILGDSNTDTTSNTNLDEINDNTATNMNSDNNGDNAVLNNDGGLTIQLSSNPTATSFNINISSMNGFGDTYRIKYKPQGTSDWNYKDIILNAPVDTVTIDNLKPSTKYEVQAFHIVNGAETESSNLLLISTNTSLSVNNNVDSNTNVNNNVHGAAFDVNYPPTDNIDTATKNTLEKKVGYVKTGPTENILLIILLISTIIYFYRKRKI